MIKKTQQNPKWEYVIQMAQYSVSYQHSREGKRVTRKVSLVTGTQVSVIRAPRALQPTLAFVSNVAVSRSQVVALVRVTDVQKTMTTEDNATSYHLAVEGHCIAT